MFLSIGIFSVNSFAAMDERAVYAAVTGQVIQRLRAGRLSQAALAARAGLSPSALSRFENGQSMPDLYEQRRLALALDRTPGQLAELFEQAFARATQVAQQVGGEGQWNRISAAAIAGLAVIAAVAILEEAEKKNRKRTTRKR